MQRSPNKEFICPICGSIVTVHIEGEITVNCTNRHRSEKMLSKEELEKEDEDGS